MEMPPMPTEPVPTHSRRHRGHAARCLLALLALPAAAIAGEPFPLPGAYRIDMESTSSSGSGPTAIERVSKVDGANGNTTVISRAGGGPPTPPQVFAGQGEVRHCVKAGDGAARAAGAAQRLGASCVNTATPVIDGDSARYTVQCAGMTQQVQTRRLDETTWEIRMTTDQPVAGGGAAMPAATATAMAPVIAQMEERLRSGLPEAEAKAITQQLALLRGGSPAGAGSTGMGGAMRTQIVQRYRKVAPTCP
jgi:hypothetical protein